MKRLWLRTACAVLLTGAGMSAQGAYTFAQFDVPGEPLFYTRYGINNAGQVVGTFTSGGVTHGFVYAGGKFTPLDVPGSYYTAAYGINDAGQVVGSFRGTTGDHGFVYASGEFTPLDVPDAFSTEAYGINDAGQVVGIFSSATGAHGFWPRRCPYPPAWGCWSWDLPPSLPWGDAAARNSAPSFCC